MFLMGRSKLYLDKKLMVYYPILLRELLSPIPRFCLTWNEL